MEDVHFADFIIADITAGLKNRMFAEIVPRTFHPLYGIAQNAGQLNINTAHYFMKFIENEEQGVSLSQRLSSLKKRKL